jgi:hypothetical protein
MNGNIIVEKSADSNDWVLHNNVGNNCKYYTPVMEISEMFKGKEASWKGAGMGDYICSLCWEVSPSSNELKYCPHCGARMFGGSE